MTTITPDELQKRLSTDKDLQLIDVREPHEHEAFNIGGQNIPLGLLAQHGEAIKEMSQKGDIIVYCQSGTRSAMAQKILDIQFQIQNALNLEGGMKRWQEEMS